MSVNRSTYFGWYPHLKHVERFTDINKLYIVASRWIIIDTCVYMYRKERGDFTRMPYLQTSCITENIQGTEGRMFASLMYEYFIF
jgi:hypothetical protein